MDMLEIIRQLALDTAEQGADFCLGTVTAESPLAIRLEEGLELGADFLVLTEAVWNREETGLIRTWTDHEGEIWYHYRKIPDRSLKTGETAALLRAADGQQYLVLGRVQKEG